MKELVLPIGVMMAWFALNAWILPKFGLRTCLSASCVAKTRSKNESSENDAGSSDPRAIHNKSERN